jgi:ATP-dependent protease ClpP protease subunit
LKRPRAQLTVTASDARRYRDLRNRLGYVPLRADRQAAQAEGRLEPWPWYRIANAAGEAGEPAQVHLYDEIGYWGVTAADFIEELASVTAPSIELHINSPGGDVYDGIAIYSALIDHPAGITVKVDALAASAASFIAQAGDTVEMGRNSELMIHDAWGMCVGNAADMLEMHALLNKASDNIASIYSARAGHGGTATWRKRMEGEAWYSASEAVEVGLADSVAKTEPRRGAATPAEDRVERRTFANRAAAPAPVKAEEIQLEEVEDAAKCPECGATVADDATECPSCGATLDVAEVEITDSAETDPWAGIDIDALEFPPASALHLAILDAADVAGLEANTDHLRALVKGEDWGLDGDALCASIIEAVRQHEHRAPEPEPEPPKIPSRLIDIGEVADALRRAVS